MAITTTPLENAAELGNFQVNAVYDGVTYQLDFKYNDREDAWYVDLSDIDGNSIRGGVKVVSNWPLLRLVQQIPRPAGEIITIDTRDIPLDPNLDDLGTHVLFGYADVATLDEEGV